MASDKKVSLLEAIKKAVDSLMTDTSLDDDTKCELLEGVLEYVEDQQQMLYEEDEEEGDEDGDEE